MPTSPIHLLSRRWPCLLRWLFASALGVCAADSFVIDDIQVTGLQRVSLGTVLAELSVAAGDLVAEKNASVWLREVYRTGFFDSVDISRVANALVIEVVERPAIESLEFSGNSTLPSERLEAVFADVGLVKGEIYNPSLLENLQLELEKQYGYQGRYNARVDEEVTALTRNRVAIKLTISEGPVARIKDIKLVGNRLFTAAELAEVLELQETRSGSIFQLISRKNNYSSAALTGDLQRLEDYYFDRGYLDFVVESRQVAISENKADISIAINMSEGERYTVARVDVIGDLKQLDEEIWAEVQVQPGDIYSRQATTAGVNAIKRLLGERGYAFAQVRDIRQPDREASTVDVLFQVVPGLPVYVNRIVIQGNSATNDEVIRRELRQLERALLINERINLSRARLQRLGYFSSVDIRTQRLPGEDDLVDVIVTVEEAKDTVFNIAGGYAEGSGFFAEASFQQNNFFGRGVDFSTSVNVNSTTQNYQLSIENPFFTLDGVSLGTDLFYENSDYSDATFSTYATNSLGGQVSVGYPLSENQRVSYGVGISRDELFLSDSAATLEMTDFLATNGSLYDITSTRFGWRHNTLNGTIKADAGESLSVGLELAVPPGELNYYRSTVAAQKFIKFADNLALRFHTDLGYGSGFGSEGLPFYKNFYSGGARSVRGYQYGSLGPLGTAPLDEDGEPSFTASPIGGNIKTEFGVELVLPTPLVDDQRAYRTALFIDSGNVFSDQCRSDNPNCENGFQFDELRYAAGIDFTWITPIAPLSFSYAWPLNAREDDYTTNFSFNIGISY